MAGLPATVARRPFGVLRPRDLSEVYAHPRPEVARLVRAGLLAPLARGYVARVPLAYQGDTTWRPDIHSAGLGIAIADVGRDQAALMHVSAARLLGALPRELAVALVAVPRQRPELSVLGGRVVFVTRHISRLDVQRCSTALGDGWATTPEQTMLDLAHRPTWAGVDETVAVEAIRWLADRVRWDDLEQLAHAQRRVAGLRRIDSLFRRDR